MIKYNIINTYGEKITTHTITITNADDIELAELLKVLDKLNAKQQ